MNDNIRTEQLIFAVPSKQRPAEAFNAVAWRAGFLVAGPDSETSRVAEGRLIDQGGVISSNIEDPWNYSAYCGTLAELNARPRLPTIDTLIMRCYDALQFMREGQVDLAIVGRDTLTEFNMEEKRNGLSQTGRVISVLPVSECNLEFIAPGNAGTVRPQDMAGKRIATSYPETVWAFLTKKRVKDFKIIKAQGGVEAYVRRGIADFGCDIVDSGDSVQQNGLKRTGIVLVKSSSLLVRANKAFSPETETVIETLSRKFLISAREVKVANDKKKRDIEREFAFMNGLRS